MTPTAWATRSRIILTFDKAFGDQIPLYTKDDIKPMLLDALSALETLRDTGEWCLEADNSIIELNRFLND